MAYDDTKEMVRDEDLTQALMKKANYFYSNQVAVHISCKDGSWYNGYIEELISDGFIIKEFKRGRMPVFFIEIYPNGIEIFTDPEKKIGGVKNGGKGESDSTTEKIVRKP